MQFKVPNTKNWRKLKKIVKSNRCVICCYRLYKTAIYVWDKEEKDCTHVKCFNCLSVYDNEFELTDVGLPRQTGEAWD